MGGQAGLGFKRGILWRWRGPSGLEEEIQPLTDHAREGRWSRWQVRGGHSLSGPAFQAQLMAVWDGTGARPSGALTASVLTPDLFPGGPRDLEKENIRGGGGLFVAKLPPVHAIHRTLLARDFDHLGNSPLPSWNKRTLE